MRMFAPSSALASFVKDLMIVEVGETVTRVRVPEPGLVLGLRYSGNASLLISDGELRLPQATLTGMTTRTRRMRTAAGGGIALARFRPGGAAQFFPQPLHQIFGMTIALADLLPRDLVERTRAQLAEARSDRERIALMEEFLLDLLQPRTPDPVVMAAVDAIEQARGAIQIGALARRLAISQDPLEKRFRRAVGASPKQFASLLRVRHVIDAYRPGARLTQLAVDAGYFDQSHFSRELRAVTGESPGRFLRGGEYR